MSLISKEIANEWAASYSTGPQADLLQSVKKLSMLHYETLQLLYNFTLHSPGSLVLEIGPYIGGSTVMIATAARACSKRVVTVEKGGSYLSHPHVPTDNIIRDLKKNLERYNVSHVVDIIEDQADSEATKTRIRHLKGVGEIGVLFIDSDGQVERDFSMYSPFLANDAFVMFDDYESETAGDKAALVRPFVEKGVQQGYLHDLGVFPWGTWAGQFSRRAHNA